jgi:hypothetical protein
VTRPAVVFAVALAAALGLALGGSSPEVTLSAQPLIIRADARVTLVGQISSGAANEYVAVQGKECGVPGTGFRSVAGALTTAGGAWSAQPQYLQSTTKLRAAWKSYRSPVVTVQVRAGVDLSERSGHRWHVGVGGIGRFDGKRLFVQRFDTGSRTWRRVTTVVVETSSYGGYAEKNDVRLHVPKGTTLRAVLPLAEAKPCYLAGYSALVRA